MPNIQLNGYTFRIEEQGTGEPLVLVHGSASDYRTWASRLDSLSNHHRTIAYSRRYHWPNDAIPEGVDYEMMRHVDDLECLLNQLGVAPAHLIGHSYGGFVCLLLVLRSPNLVRTLGLVEPPAITLFASDPPRPHEVLRLLLSRPRTAAAIISFGVRGWGPAVKAARRGELDSAVRSFGRAVLGPDAFERLSAARRDQIKANAIRMEFLGSGFPSLDVEKVGAISMPTLLVTGRESPALFARVVDRLEELIPQTERVDIEGASHIVHEDRPEAFDDAVLSFISRHAGSC